MVKVELTGKTRARAISRWFRRPLLVLQIEVRTHGYEVLDAMGNGHDVDRLDWRDARVEDLEELHSLWTAAAVEHCGGAT
jgi:uncharacterized protein YcaQ